jgi:hypothetical protein
MIIFEGKMEQLKIMQNSIILLVHDRAYKAQAKQMEEFIK